MMTFIEAVKPLITLENAKAYRKDREKYLFCAYLLTDHDIAESEARVNYLEDRFDELLDAEEGPDLCKHGELEDVCVRCDPHFYD